MRFALCILLLFTTPALADKPTLRIKLRILKPLQLVQLVHRGKPVGSVGLRGKLEVQLENSGTTTLKLERLSVHNLLFIDNKGKSHLLVHACECMMLMTRGKPPRPALSLKPGASRVITLQEWGCSGGYWAGPPPGNYRLTYRIRPAGKGYSKTSKQNHRKINQLCQAMLKRRSFWTNAWQSKPLRIRLRRPQRVRSNH